MISVIIPIYNVQDYIEECLKSVIAQTYKNIEILCIDDCGLDNSISVVKKYMIIDSRIRLICHEENKGLGGGRNTGIKHAKGEYICFIDSDDIIDETMLEKMHAAILNYDVDAVICKIECFQNNNIWYSSSFHYLRESKSRVFNIKNNKHRLTDIYPSAWNKLYKVEIIKKYNIYFPEKLLYEDHYFFYKYFCNIDRFYFLSESLYKYRVSRENSILTTSTRREYEIYKVFDLIFPIFRKYFGKYYDRSVLKIAFRLLWERAITLNNNKDVYFYIKFLVDSRKFIFELTKDKDIFFIKNSIDEFISHNDIFYKFIFGNYIFYIFIILIKKKLKKYSFLRKIKHKLNL